MSDEKIASNANKRQIIVFPVGVFDISKKPIENLTNHIIPQFTDFMIKLHRLAKTYDGKVIYLSVPPSVREIAKKADGRNNAKIAANNKLVINVVRPHDVAIVNSFAMALSIYREANSYGHHFYNDVGEIIARQLLFQIGQPK